MGVLKFVLWTVAVVLALVALTLFAARFADGPLEIIAGGPLTSGELHQGMEPDWTFLNDLQTVEFQLLDPPRSRTTWILEHNGRVFIPSGYMNSTVGKLPSGDACCTGQA